MPVPSSPLMVQTEAFLLSISTFILSMKVLRIPHYLRNWLNLFLSHSITGQYQSVKQKIAGTKGLLQQRYDGLKADSIGGRCSTPCLGEGLSSTFKMEGPLAHHKQ